MPLQKGWDPGPGGTSSRQVKHECGRSLTQHRAGVWALGWAGWAALTRVHVCGGEGLTFVETCACAASS